MTKEQYERILSKYKEMVDVLHEINTTLTQDQQSKEQQ